MIKAVINVTRTGRFQASILDPKISSTGHEITMEAEPCVPHGFTVRSIINGNLLCHNATLEQAERDIAMEWLAFTAAYKPETSRELDARWDSFPQAGPRIATIRLRTHLAEKALRPILKPGDRLRATKAECGKKEASFIFSHWDHGWIVSTGGSSISPGTVYSINHEIFRI
ncbi:hypothetical protein [Agrobacterium vitis]|uniref:hypothetical protein n=1 Tax=Agrobacterium vitis TaxID=373 RepID=UPI0018D20041|nr:hypothetical protein [Agrobacterium vitis]